MDSRLNQKIHYNVPFLRIALVVVFSIFGALPLYGQGVWVEDFSEINEDDYHIGDDAYWSQDEEFLVLTEPQPSLAGRIYTIQDYPMAIFTAEFDIRIGGGNGADGMTFAWVVDYDYARVNGGALNFRDADGFAIEFDCYGGGEDPNGQHIGLVQNDARNHLDTWVTDQGVIEDNEWHNVRVVNFLGLIQVFWEDELVLEHQIEDYEPFLGHFGFTAGTGAVYNWHIVDNVEIAVGGPVIEVVDELVEFGPVPVDNVSEQVFQIANIAEDEDEWHELEFTVTDDGEGPDWLTADPEEGVVEAGQVIDITLTANTEELELGEYERDIIISSNDGENPEVAITAHIFVVEGFGRLFGIVTNAENGEPVEGASVTIPAFGFSTDSDENGIYNYAEIPAWVYDITVTREDFLPLEVADVEINPDQEVERDFAFLHADFEPSRERIEVQLASDETLDVPVMISNPGNGALTWAVHRQFPEGMEAEPWEHRAGIPAADIVENSRLGGVEFVDGHFYLTGGVSDGDNVIYVLNPEGELVRQFNQFADSRYGYRDLAYDGDLLWGVDGAVVHGFTLEGELEVELNSPLNGIRGITWDPENELLWMCGITTRVFAIDRNGEVVRELDRFGDLRTYGLAWYPDASDGFYLRLFCSNGDFNRQIFKANPETGDYEFITEPDIEGSAGAATVNRRWDPFSWVLIGVTNSPDRIEIWHIDAPTGWVDINPTEGVVEPDEETEIIITLDTRDFPVNIEFTADLVFTHDGVGGETIIPVSLIASEEGGVSERILDLPFGWNMVSVNVVPEEPDVVALTVELVENDLLEIMKNGAGQFYSPAFNFNNIPGWMVDQGYLMKTADDCQLTITGETVAPDLRIELHRGWQMIAYYPRVPVEATVALSGIVESLEMAKDGAGHFYSPAFGFSNIGDMREGQGYLVKVTEDVDLQYIVPEGNFIGMHFPFVQNPVLTPTLEPTSENMSLLLLSENPQVSDNFDVKVYAGDKLVGSGFLGNEQCGVAVWGDDPTTEIIDGAEKGQALRIELCSSQDNNREYSFSTISGAGEYSKNSLWIVDVDSEMSPMEFGIVETYPNPFNSMTRLSFNIFESGEVNLSVLDLKGRLIKTIITEHLQAGTHSVMVNGDDLASGIYIGRLNTKGRTYRKKLILIK